MVRHSERPTYTIMYFKTLLILSSLTLTFIPSQIEYVEASKMPEINKMDTKEEYIEYIYKRAVQGKFEPSSVVNTIKCESGFNKDAVGDNGTSFGLVQIHLPAHPYVTKEEATDPQFALDFIIDAFKNGQQKMWTCARILGYSK